MVLCYQNKTHTWIKGGNWYQDLLCTIDLFNFNNTTVVYSTNTNTRRFGYICFITHIFLVFVLNKMVTVYDK